MAHPAPTPPGHDSKPPAFTGGVAESPGNHGGPGDPATVKSPPWDAFHGDENEHFLGGLRPSNVPAPMPPGHDNTPADAGTWTKNNYLLKSAESGKDFID